MKKSKNAQVQAFIDDLEMLDIDKFKLLVKLREIVLSQNPKTRERIMYGGILFSLEDDFAGLFVRKNHVSFEFSFGVHMEDPDAVLEGGGKHRRHLKLRSLKDIRGKNVASFVKQAIAAETG